MNTWLSVDETFAIAPTPSNSKSATSTKNLTSSIMVASLSSMTMSTVTPLRFDFSVVFSIKSQTFLRKKILKEKLLKSRKKNQVNS